MSQRNFNGHPALDGRTNGKGSRCFALTLFDDHSRYLPRAQACAKEMEATSCERLGRMSDEHCLPHAMINENGNPSQLQELTASRVA